MSGRDGMRLTDAAQDDRSEFEAKYGDSGNCSCHVSPPCDSCLHPGNPNNQAEVDEAWEPDPEAAQPLVDAAERERILGVFAAILDAPLANGLFERVTAVERAVGRDIECATWNYMLRAALFCDDVEVAHPELDRAAIRRVATDSLLRAAVLCVNSAKKLEGAAFDPARFALVVFSISETWLNMSTVQEHGVFADYKPGTLRAELEAEGLIEPLQSTPTVEATPL